MGRCDWMIFHLLLFLRIMIFRCSIKCPEWVNWCRFHQLRFINFSLRISNAIKNLAAEHWYWLCKIDLSCIKSYHIFSYHYHTLKRTYTCSSNHRLDLMSVICIQSYVSCFVWLCLWPWMLWLCYWSLMNGAPFGAKCDNIWIGACSGSFGPTLRSITCHHFT